VWLFFFFFNDTATTEIYTLSLHDALPISRDAAGLAALLATAFEDAKFRAALGRQCAARRPLFSPAAEARALQRLVTQLA